MTASPYERIEQLRSLIQHHNHLYYDLNTSEITDTQYDMMTEELKQLEAQYPELRSSQSPTQQVGGGVDSTLGRIEHAVPMLSIDDYFSEEDLLYNFIHPLRTAYGDQLEFVVEQKIDGLSASIQYENNRFTLGSTRGNGKVGEDVTENISHISTLPSTLNHPLPLLEVRGEVYMSQPTFEALNLLRQEAGEPPFANARNAASGALKLKDSSESKNRKLDLFIFNVQRVQGHSFTTHSESLEYLKKEGFPVIPDWTVCTTDEEILQAIHTIGDKRNSLPYGIDGAVIKVNSLSLREAIGATDKSPKWAAAYKYPAEQKETVVRDIKLQVGRTGRITPVAVFDPVQLAGTTVTNATLHNQAQIDRLDIGIGDTIIMEKAGDIIPAVAKVLHDKRPESVTTFKIPSFCPECGSPVTLDGSDMKCTNPLCPAQFQRSVEFFASRPCMDIRGLGENAAAKLIQHGFIQSLPDIYHLHEHKEELIRSKCIGREKSVSNLLNAIESSKQQPLPRFIKALGIPNIGEHIGKALMDHCVSNPDDLLRLPSMNLSGINGIGEISSCILQNFFATDEAKDLIAQFKAAGVFPQKPPEPEPSDDTYDAPLAGKTLVVTGTLTHYTRAEIEHEIRMAGGTIGSSVTKKTTWLVAGSKAGSKLAKAQKLGIPVLSEHDLLYMLQHSLSEPPASSDTSQPSASADQPAKTPPPPTVQPSTPVKTKSSAESTAFHSPAAPAAAQEPALSPAEPTSDDHPAPSADSAPADSTSIDPEPSVPDQPVSSKSSADSKASKKTSSKKPRSPRKTKKERNEDYYNLFEPLF